MSDPVKSRNERLAERLIKNLKRRHYNAYFCRSAEELRAQVKQLIPDGSSISWGGSSSIRSTGVTTMLKQGPYEVYDRDDVTTMEDKLRIYRRLVHRLSF